MRIIFKDLKKYHYYYWFAFPVPANLTVEKIGISPITKFFSEEEVLFVIVNLLLFVSFKRLFQLVDVYDQYHALSLEQKSFFLIKQHPDYKVEVLPLRRITPEMVVEPELRVHFAFSDPSTSENYPGWPVRNFIAFILHIW